MTLFEQIVSFENLHDAYRKACRRKRFRYSILKFGYNLEENLLVLRQDLISRIYKHGGYREFIVIDSKKRLIKAPSFRDRVVHHALCNVIEPILDCGFIYDSYACRKRKGTHAAIRRLESFLRSARERERIPLPCFYCLQCDVSKYFESVDHDILLAILRRKIKDEDVLWLVERIIRSNLRGIPIGNLTSQLFANVYLNELDQFIKRRLRIRYYIRYMDDFLLLDFDKKKLHQTKEIIRQFLQAELRLELHPKKAQIFPVNAGIDFLGYVVRDHRRFLRKSTVKRFLKKRKRYSRLVEEGRLDKAVFRNICVSWRGYARFANSYQLMRKLDML